MKLNENYEMWFTAVTARNGSNFKNQIKTVQFSVFSQLK